MPTAAERQFHSDMVAGAQRLKREIGYNPVRFTQMLGEIGGVATAKQLLRGRDASDGFTTLWNARRLDVSVEAFVLLPWYEGLFTDAERDTARRRLEAHEFDVARYLGDTVSSPPSWVSDSVNEEGAARDTC
ncbi:hypothetical protein ACGFNX_19910 [Streptomyces sp. NPDC048723]|uniref:hypothetical protein n=1 Tax=unclassified Streptomyces TaxID=2593676 RepID=UPI00224C7FF4|nr:hypothetical protein [Streptomyces sp. NBC_01443]MCX4632914.1 hypothetical protein [Streptomyces sp. NBC_01443]